MTSLRSAAAAVAASLLITAASRAENSPEAVVFTGMCDASAAAAIDVERFVVADDEDNILRVYARTGGAALAEFDLSAFLGNQGKKKPKEADLEAAAQLGGRTYWITSHGRNSKGKDQPARQRLFATTTRIDGQHVAITPVGEAHSDLLAALIADPRLAGYNLERAATLAPKAKGGLNIEGLAATPDGHLLIGFRNPVPEGGALVVPLLNPAEVVNGAPARFGPPTEIRLGGLGIRSLEWCAGRYLIIAGASGEENSSSRLFEWDGQGQPTPIVGVTLTGLNPEGISFQGTGTPGEYFILSDDGGREVAGQDCKDLQDASLKRFRGRALRF